MNINVAKILQERMSRSWTQEELSIAAGLSLRTIQRIENEATASAQSRKAIAAALDMNVSDLTHEESSVMKKYQYKTVELPFKFGIFKQGIPDIDQLLNAEGEAGWRLHQIVVPASSNFGQSDKMVVIFEREK